MSTIYVNSAWTDEAAFNADTTKAEGLVWGTNAFSTFEAAVAAASKDSVIKVMAGTTVNNNVTFMNADPTGGYYDMLTEERNYGAYISGAVKMEQVIWNNSDLTIDSTGLVRTGEAFRVMGGSLTINGKRAANEDAPADLVPDHWGIGFEPHEKVSAQVGYLQVALGAEAKVNNAYVVVTAQTVDVGWEVAPGTAQPSSLTLNNSYLFVGNQGTYNGISTVSVHNESVFALENNSVLIGRTGESFNINIESGSTLSAADSELARVDKITNNGALIISGASTVTADKFAGNGWVYMKDAAVGADTKLIGANVRFASGTNVVDGATINGGRFQVGTGTYQAPDGNVDTENGVIVTVKNNAHIGGIDGGASPFGGWVGSEFYDAQADKDAAMTDARYTLNIDKSIAEFGYLHISHDGILNVTGNADELHSINATNYTFRAGQFNINGVATFAGNAQVMAFNTNVSCDNATATPGKLIVTNGAVFYAKHEDSGLAANFKVWKNGIVEVSNGATFNIGEKGAVLNIDSADAQMSITNATLNAGKVINYGSFLANGSTIKADSFYHYGTAAVFNNVDLTIGYLYDGDSSSPSYAVVGGESKVQISRIEGFYSLRLADDAVLKDGSSISSFTVRSLGDATFGIAAGDKVSLCDYDNRCGTGMPDDCTYYLDKGHTITVNGELTIAGSWFSVLGSGTYYDFEADGRRNERAEDQEIVSVVGDGKITMTGTANAIFQYGFIDISADVETKGDIRFTLAGIKIKDCTIKTTQTAYGETTLQSSDVAMDNAVIDSSADIFVGYQWGPGNKGGSAWQSFLTVENSSQISTGRGFYINDESVVSLSNSTLTVAGKMVLLGAASLSIAEKSTVTIGSSLSLEANSVLTISADSFLSAETMTGNGTITIDDTGITIGAELKKIIDLNQSGALTKVSLVEGSANNLVFGADGDVYITNQNASTIYVNAAWKDAEVGTAVAGGYIYGLNAFSTFNEIFGGAVSAETTKLVIAGGTYSSLFNTTTGVSIMSGLSAVEASGEVVVDLGSLVFETEVADDVYVTGNFTTTDTNTWNYELGLMPYYNGAIQFKGTEDTTFNIDGIFNAAEGFTFDTRKAIISADSVLTVNNQHCGQINVYGDVVSYGAMSVDLQVGSTERLVNIGKQGKLTLSGANASLYTNIINDQPWPGAHCVDFYISNGSLVVEKGATVNATGIVEVYADSSITVDGSSFTAGIVDNKAGSVTVSGASSINIGTLTGRMTLKNATLGNGSVIGGKAGCVDLAGEEVNFNGTVLIENAVNANASTDATVININKGANVTFNTKQYNDGTYSGGFNSSSADTLNVYGNLTISGDNVYLKAATLVDKDAVFNISDAGFQNTYGTLTIKGAMNITDTAEGGYQNIKLSGNDNASTTGDLDIVGGTLTINAPSFSFGGGFKSNGWVDVKSATVDVTEGGKITTNAVVFRNGVSSTLTLNNGSLVFTAAGEFGNVHSTLGTAVDNFGAIVAVNGSILDFGTRNLINEGSISFDLTSTLSANSITGAGSINISINTKQLTTGYTLINQTGAAALDITNINVTIDGVESTLANLFGEDVFAVIDDGYVLVKSDNDLVVSSVNTLYVSSDLAETAAGTVITVNGDQYVVGVNAFGTLADISGKVSEAPCTIVYDYAADLEAGNAGMIVTVKNDETSLVSYTVNGEYHNFYSSRTHEIAFDANSETKTVNFVFTSGDFSFTSSPVEGNVEEAIGPGVAEDVSVDEIAGDKVYTFTVTEEQGDFSCAISDVTGTGEIAIYDAAGNLVANRLFNRDANVVLEGLATGKYEVVFSGYGYNAEADFEADMTLTQYEIPACRKDDTLESVTGTTAVSSVAGEAGETDGRGEVDTTDWIKLNGFTPGVQNALEFTVSGSPVSVSLYNGEEQLLANFYVYDSKEGDAVDYTRYFSAATDVVYARLSTTGEADYSVAVVTLP